MDNNAGWDLNDVAGSEKYGAKAEWPYAFNKANDIIILIDKNSIDGKAHEKHVNGFTVGDNQSLSRLEGLPVEKPDHPGKKGVCEDTFLGDDRVLCCVKD